jgi:hypothetical protein
MKSFLVKSILACTLFSLFAIQTTSSFGQAFKAQIGFNDLVAEKGAALEDGSGLRVFMAEAPDGDTDTNPNGDYMPDINNAQFSGKDLKEASGASGANGHATSVAVNFFGNSSSLSAGITDFTGYDANGYIGSTGLNAGTNLDPGGLDLMGNTYHIGNHSYVGRASTAFTAAQAEDILERLDFTVNRDNTVQVVAADNASTTPRVLTPAYNAIAVGRSDGSHSRTLTPNYGAPRFATAIVVPSAGATSQSTPVVSSAAAILVQAGQGSNFSQNEVIRASLYAGATKEEFATWDRTSTRPMDEVFGYGELNILNSYHIFEGGEFEASTSDPATNVDLLGWDYGDFDGSTELFYDFSIDETEYGRLSAVLSWNMNIIDNDSSAVFDPTRDLADLNLDLFDSTGSFLGTLLDSSNGTDYNNEHIFARSLAAGDYTFRISGAAGGTSATDYGFAWNIVSAVPEPSSLIVLGVFGLGCIARRRRSV